MMTEVETRILDFADRWWRTAGAHEEAVRAEFGMTVTRYMQVLNQLIDREDALAHNPVLVNRLRRQRNGRR